MQAGHDEGHFLAPGQRTGRARRWAPRKKVLDISGAPGTDWPMTTDSTPGPALAENTWHRNMCWVGLAVSWAVSATDTVLANPTLSHSISASLSAGLSSTSLSH
jgi:hypothetical protein